MASVVGTPASIEDNSVYTAEAGSNRVVFAVFGGRSTSTLNVTAASMGAQAMTEYYNYQEQPGTGNNIHMQCFYILEADIPSGSQEMTATWNLDIWGDDMSGVIFTCKDVDQTTPFVNTVDMTGTNTPAGTLAYTSTDDSVQIAHLQSDEAAANPFTPPAGWTEVRDWDEPDNTAWSAQVMYKAYVTGSTTGSITYLESGGPYEWGLKTFNVQNVSSSLSVTDVDTDESITNTQTNVIVTGTNFEASQGTGTVKIENSGATISVTQTIDSWANASIQFDTSQGGLPFATTHECKVTNNSADSSSLTISMVPVSGNSYTNCSDHIDDTSSVFSQLTGTVSDIDQIEYENLSGDLVIASNGTLTYSGSSLPVTFDVRARDSSDDSWSAFVTASITDGTDNAAAGGIEGGHTFNGIELDGAGIEGADGISS